MDMEKLFFLMVHIRKAILKIMFTLDQPQNLTKINLTRRLTNITQDKVKIYSKMQLQTGLDKNRKESRQLIVQSGNQKTLKRTCRVLKRKIVRLA